MAEPDKVAASSTKAKEKKSSILDDDISKNFLSSWNTSLGAESEDSLMDFKYEPAKGKKEKFNFDALGMDFSLDGDFGKMDSFKVDMGDLDFTSPAKTSAKSKAADLDFSSPKKDSTELKGKLQGDSVKSNKAKKDCFDFSFDFNDLGKFDIDTVLRTRTKALAKDDGDSGGKIKSTDRQDDQGSNVQLTGNDAEEADVLNENSKLANPINSKENLAAFVDDLDMLPQSDSSKTSSAGVNTDKLSQSENKACSESGEKSQVQNQDTHYVQDQRPSKPALICSEGAITEHAQREDKQSDQVKSSSENSNEMPKVQNQSACSFLDKISAPDVLKEMQTPLEDEKADDADSERPTLNAKIDSSFASENENCPADKMMPLHKSKHVRDLEVVLEGTAEEENSSERSNVLKGDMDTTTVDETVIHVKERDVVDHPKLGPHAAEPTSGRQKLPTEISSSLVSRFNLKPPTKDESPVPAQVLPKSNLVSLNRNASSLHPNPSGARHNANSERFRSNKNRSPALYIQEARGGYLVSENTIKVANNQSNRGDCNTMEAQTNINLDVGGKAAEKGATYPGNETKKENTKASSIQVQSSVLPDWTSKTGNQSSLNLKPKIQTSQPVRMLKMDTIMGKLSTLTVSKKMMMPNLEGLKLLSSPTLKDKAVTANNLNRNEMTVIAKKVVLVGSVKPRSPALSLKRKISEVSGAATIISNPSKRLSASHIRTSKDDTERMAQGEVGFHKSNLDCSLKSDSNKQSECTFKIPHEMKLSDTRVLPLMENDETVEKAEAFGKELDQVGFHKSNLDCSLKSDSNKQSECTFKIPHEMKLSDTRVPPLMENDETVEKAEAFGKELDQICSILRKKQEEAKQLLVQALVTNNRILLLGSYMHTQKISL